MTTTTPTLNLNKLQIQVDNTGLQDLNDNSITHGQTQVYFRDLADKLVSKIDQADVVVGCVAWLTHPHVLRHLFTTDGVSLIVQKEDLWRPDLASTNYRIHKARSTRDEYQLIIDSCSMNRVDLPEPLCSMNVCGDPTLQAIRCMGNHNSTRRPASPRMHNKFLVFAKRRPQGIIPYAVWTGSFNMTYNAGCSFENALYITDTEIVDAYFNEYLQIAALSEPLDWESDWCEPEWRIGT